MLLWKIQGAVALYAFCAPFAPAPAQSGFLRGISAQEPVHASDPAALSKAAKTSRREIAKFSKSLADAGLAKEVQNTLGLIQNLAATEEELRELRTDLGKRLQKAKKSDRTLSKSKLKGLAGRARTAAGKLAKEMQRHPGFTVELARAAHELDAANAEAGAALKLVLCEDGNWRTGIHAPIVRRLEEIRQARNWIHLHTPPAVPANIPEWASDFNTAKMSAVRVEGFTVFGFAEKDSLNTMARRYLRMYALSRFLFEGERGVYGWNGTHFHSGGDRSVFLEALKRYNTRVYGGPFQPRWEECAYVRLGGQGFDHSGNIVRACQGPVFMWVARPLGTPGIPRWLGFGIAHLLSNAVWESDLEESLDAWAGEENADPTQGPALTDDNWEIDREYLRQMLREGKVPPLIEWKTPWLGTADRIRATSAQFATEYLLLSGKLTQMLEEYPQDPPLETRTEDKKREAQLLSKSLGMSVEEFEKEWRRWVLHGIPRSLHEVLLAKPLSDQRPGK